MSSIRRLKDRGGSGCKISAVNPTKSLTPDKLPAAGKENSTRKPRLPATATTHKPAVKVIPRVDKAAAVSGDRKRLSALSAPRGRSPSPTQFSRVSSIGKDSKVVSVGDKSKFPSKLHEKLAFLEGKVKRIASDIKRTKEMLDANNPDVSKVILSDIQDKISGIEKAMENAVDVKCSSQEPSIGNEYLVSLNKEMSSITIKNEDIGLNSNPFDVQAMEGGSTSSAQGSFNVSNGVQDIGVNLTSDEKLEDFDDRENRPGLIIGQESSDSVSYPLNEIGHKNSTAGWFVSDGEAVLLAHDDGSCSYYDIVNSEEKATYKPLPGVSHPAWGDCWILRAPSSDGTSGKYVVAASAGNTMDTGFCSWDFYTGDVRGFHVDGGGGGPATSRAVLGPLKISREHDKISSCSAKSPENQQWWYRPCGPLIISAASSQKLVKIYDIRDGEQVMTWELQKPVSSMDHSSPLQWRNRGNVVIAEAESITLWDVNSLSPQALRSIPLHGRKVSALHVNNADAEISGGVRRRVTSSEAEVNSGVFCTPESINILDFRDRTGVGFRIPNLGDNVQSVFSRGDSVYLGCTNVRSAGKSRSCAQVQQYSLRKQRIVASYDIPESNMVDHRDVAITQVWGNSDFIMAVSGLGLFIFDPLKDDGLHSVALNFDSIQKARQVVGPDDLYSPTFDYSSSRALLISRDRPALWKHIEEACIL